MEISPQAKTLMVVNFLLRPLKPNGSMVDMLSLAKFLKVIE